MYKVEKGVNADVWTPKGKITLDSNTEQSDLKYLYGLGIAGIAKSEKAEKAEKKSDND